MNNKYTLGIIGTSGRMDDGARVNTSVYFDMYAIANVFVKTMAEKGYIFDTLISGGSAWADHIVIEMLLRNDVPNGHLCLPCNFTGINFVGNNSATILNDIHTKFTSKTTKNKSSLSEISNVLNGRATYSIYNGFTERNRAIANKSDFILAMTFGNKNIVKSGGTSNTVRSYLIKTLRNMQFNKAFHYNLNDKKLYPNATVE